MATVELTRCVDRQFPQPGEFMATTKENGERSALACCPDCGKIASLSGHTIADDGKVSPSLVCPTDGCGFHAFVRLTPWL